jgi:hypothetical protein
MHLALLMSLVSALPTEAFDDHCVRLVAQPSHVVTDVDGDGVDEQMTSAGAGCGSGFCGVGHDIRLSRDGTVVTTANDVSRFVMQQTLPIEPKIAALFPSPLEQALVVFGAFCSTPDPSLRATQQRRVSWVDGPPRAPERPYAWVSTSSSTCHGSAPCAVVWFGFKHGDAASWRAVGAHGGTTLRVTDRGGLVLVDEARERHRWLYQYEGYARRVVARGPRHGRARVPSTGRECEAY